MAMQCGKCALFHKGVVHELIRHVKRYQDSTNTVMNFAF